MQDTPTQQLHGRASPAPVFGNLSVYVVTMHFNEQSTVELCGDTVAHRRLREARLRLDGQKSAPR